MHLIEDTKSKIKISLKLSFLPFESGSRPETQNQYVIYNGFEGNSISAHNNVVLFSPSEEINISFLGQTHIRSQRAT